MRIGGLLEWKDPADGHENLAADRQIEQFRQPGPESRGGEERRRSETGEGLVFEDQPEKVGDAEIEMLNVERAINDDLTQGRQDAQALHRHVPAGRFVDDVRSGAAGRREQRVAPKRLRVVDADVGPQ